MTDLAAMAEQLKELLQLEIEPVGVKVFSNDEEIPESVRNMELEKPIKSYCQGLNLAARGQTIFGGKEKLGCILGTTTLGLEKDPEPLLDDTVLEKYGVGLFETEEASKSSVDGVPMFEVGANQSVLMAPLSSFQGEPQLVILEVDPEQTMWLLYGANYLKGGGQKLPQSGGVAGGCSDVTVVPLTSGDVNVTFLGLGCRLKSKIPRDHLLFGLPANRMAEIVDSLSKMAKPMAMLAKAK